MATKRTKKTMIIRAVKKGNGYVLRAENGEYPEEGYKHPSAADAYRAARILYPANSVWHGKKISSGYQITIE